jgi:hypothetical protein
MSHKTIPNTYKQFLALAGDDGMKEFILKENPGLSENELWHKYLEYDNKAPFSNYCSGHGHQNGGANAMAEIAIDIEDLRPENRTKIRIRNFINQVITSEDYQKIGPAIDHFGFFIYQCRFENEELMKDLLAFIVNLNVPIEYRIIMFGRAEQIFQNSKGFKHFRKTLNQSSNCNEVKEKQDFIYKKEHVHSTPDFLKEVFDEYKK